MCLNTQIFSLFPRLHENIRDFDVTFLTPLAQFSFTQYDCNKLKYLVNIMYRFSLTFNSLLQQKHRNNTSSVTLVILNKDKWCNTWQLKGVVPAWKLLNLFSCYKPSFTRHFQLVILWCLVTFYNLPEWTNTFIPETQTITDLWSVEQHFHGFNDTFSKTALGSYWWNCSHQCSLI